MKFFKKNNDESKVVPTFPTGYGCVKSCEDSFETIHPSICPLHYPTLFIHLFIEEIILGKLTSVPFVGTHVANNAMLAQRFSQILAIKPGIKITEKAINGDTCIYEIICHLFYTILYFIEISMVSALRLRHSEWQTLSVTEKEGVCCGSLLTALVFNLLTSAVCRRVRTVYMRKREISLILLPLEKDGSLPYCPIQAGMRFSKTTNVNKAVR